MKRICREAETAVLLLVLLLVSVFARQEDRMVELQAGNNSTFGLEGDVEEGCRFVITTEVWGARVTCCYSAERRGNSLCNPSSQGDSCRKRNSFMVEEMVSKKVSSSGDVFIGHCILHLHEVDTTDAGEYVVVFPGSLADSGVITVRVTGVPWSWKWIVSISGIVSFVALAGLFLRKNPANFWSRCEKEKYQQSEDGEILETAEEGEVDQGEEALTFEMKNTEIMEDDLNINSEEVTRRDGDRAGSLALHTGQEEDSDYLSRLRNSRVLNPRAVDGVVE